MSAYTLTGAESLDYFDVAALFTEELGRLPIAMRRFIRDNPQCWKE